MARGLKQVLADMIPAGKSVFKALAWMAIVLCGIVPFAAIVVLVLLHPVGHVIDQFNWLSVISAVVGVFANLKLDRLPVL